MGIFYAWAGTKYSLSDWPCLNQWSWQDAHLSPPIFCRMAVLDPMELARRPFFVALPMEAWSCRDGRMPNLCAPTSARCSDGLAGQRVMCCVLAIGDRGPVCVDEFA